MDSALKLFIAEDEVLTAMFLQHQFEKHGFEILKIVANGRDAVEYATKLNPDAILMDIRLAGDLDGIKAAEFIRSTLTSPIIFMTGYAASDYNEQVKLINNSAIFEKPIRVEDVVNRIRTFLLNNDSIN